MKAVVINETTNIKIPDLYTLNLTKLTIKDCTGCWSCWWKTPGRCIFQDLDEFYRQYLAANKAIFFASVKKGFVSGNMKSLFDRMIPLYLPYITYKTGESMHLPRYDNYPDIEFYYDGDFHDDNSRQIYENYIRRVFYQFHTSLIKLKPMAEYVESGGEGV